MSTRSRASIATVVLPAGLLGGPLPAARLLDEGRPGGELLLGEAVEVIALRVGGEQFAEPLARPGRPRRARRRPAGTSCAGADRSRSACRWRLGVAPDAEEVVDGLEGETEVVAVRLQRVGGAVVGAAEHRADGDGAGQQRAGLVALHLQALLDGDPLAVLVGDVLRLAVDELAGGGGQPAGRAAGLDGAELQQDLVGEGEEGVADEDGLGGAVHLPDGVAVPALFVTVHQVVVQQREVVDQLDRDGAGDADLGRGSGHLGGQQRERGAHGLAAVTVRGAALGVDPAEVVGGDGVHGRRQPVHGSTQHRGGQGPPALQQRGDVAAVVDGRVSAGGTVGTVSPLVVSVRSTVV